MNIKDAMEILGLEKEELTEQTVKKKYHKLALKYHPDKNSSAESNATFQQINEAFEIVKESLGEKEKEKEEKEEENSYSNILSLFLQTLFNNENIKIITCILLHKDAKITENIEKETLLKIYSFLIEYKDILHIDSELLFNVKEIIAEKYRNVSIIVLNPSLKDLIENNIYKLLISSKTYYIPLWHSELYLECDNETIVKCIPELPENITVDDNNNLLITSSLILSSSLFPIEKNFVIQSGEYSWSIPFSQLFLKELQTITLKSVGIPRINPVNAFDVSEKGDIIFKISIQK